MLKNLFLVFFLIGCSIAIEHDEPEVIIYEEGLSFPTFILGSKKTYEIKFIPKEKAPKDLHIQVRSANNIQQSISFSNKDQKCKKSNKIMVNNPRMDSLDLLLKPGQYKNKQLFLCVECVLSDECEFTLIFNSESIGNEVKIDDKEEEIENNQIILEPPKESKKNGEVNLFATTKTANIYTLGSKCLTLPSGYLPYYQITGASSTAKYSVKGGVVTCDSKGYVIPKNTTWYWYGNIGYSSPMSGSEPTSISVSYELGTSTITVMEGSTVSQTITVNVLDYATVYAQKKIDDYIKANITSKMTIIEKLKKATLCPALYSYNASYSGYVSMVACGGGDCWASTSAINYICGKIGIESHTRYGANDGGAGSGHRNVAAKVGDDVYICEAGYSQTSTPRPYNVDKENQGWYYSNRNGNLTIKQYDGFLEKIVLPSTIDGKTVTGLGEKCFYWGQTYSGMDVRSIKLPDTLKVIGKSAFNSVEIVTSISVPENVEEIGQFAFTNMLQLTQIKVDSDNKNFTSSNGILFTKDKKELLFYPTNKQGNYTAHAKLERIAGYSFYYTKNVTAVYLPPSLKFVGEGAFGDSKIKEIYFGGDEPPEFEDFAFANIDVTIYYPEGQKEKWENLGKYNARSMKLAEWDPIDFESHTVLIVVLCFIIVGLLAGGAFFLWRRYKLRSDNAIAGDLKFFKFGNKKLLK